MISKKKELVLSFPTTYNEIFTILSKETGIDKNDLKIITAHPFSEVRKHISKGTAITVKFRRFGTFTTYYSVVNKNIKLWIDGYRSGEVPRYYAVKKVTELLKIRSLWTGKRD